MRGVRIDPLRTATAREPVAAVRLGLDDLRGGITISSLSMLSGTIPDPLREQVDQALRQVGLTCQLLVVVQGGIGFLALRLGS
jgi:hypothetical protein